MVRGTLYEEGPSSMGKIPRESMSGLRSGSFVVAFTTVCKPPTSQIESEVFRFGKMRFLLE